jgi:glycosyltransferase involved in cell wall biosynthesis
MKKIAFVVQRYGLEVNGGAELECRQYAEHLQPFYDVEVLTTKAIDYVTWKNEYKNDVDNVNGITVRRFSVDKQRNQSKFNRLSAQVVGVPHKEELEDEWFDSQGPFVPSLVEYIRAHKDEYDVFLFMTYLYYTTVKCLPEVKDKAILIPTAHDEPPVYLKFFKKLFLMPKGIYYNTIEEKKFVEAKFNNAHILNNGGVGGVGIEVPEIIDNAYLKKERNIDNYIVYVGRIDEAKGCKQLFEYFERYKENNPQQKDLKLVLIGKAVISVPQREDVISLGFVSDEVKFNVVAGAKLLVMPSQFESLSIVVLEAMSLSVPIVVNGRCSVLKGHCIHGNSGLYYKNYYEFEGCINYLLSHEREHELIGKNGVAYVNANYKWEIIVERFREMIDKI